MRSLLVAIVIAALFTSANAADVITPNIEGMCDLDAIQRIAKQAGMVAKEKSNHGPVDTDAKDIGCAYRQSPNPGKRAKKGSALKYLAWYDAG